MLEFKKSSENLLADMIVHFVGGGNVSVLKDIMPFLSTEEWILMTSDMFVCNEFEVEDLLCHMYNYRMIDWKYKWQDRVNSCPLGVFIVRLNGEFFKKKTVEASIKWNKCSANTFKLFESVLDERGQITPEAFDSIKLR